MTPIFLDFETYWSVTHSLTKMPPTEYVMHPDTELISVAYKVGGAPTQCVMGEQNVIEAMQALDWSDAMAIGHNMSGFDAMILAWRCGVRPKMWGCTLAMARPRYAKTCGLSLRRLADHLGLGEKGSLEATNTKGKHYADFTADEVMALIRYNAQDTELCARLFKHLYQGFPKRELRLLDMTVRMLVEPAFELDTDLVQRSLAEVQQEKRDSLVRLGGMLGLTAPGALTSAADPSVDLEEIVRRTLASTGQFAQLLERLGVSTPMKRSPTNPEKWVPALAKTDEAFLDLMEHDDPLVAEAARVRLAVKSTLLETRLQALLAASRACRGLVPVPLKYCGADTTGRWSGEQYNMQNLPRIPRDKEGAIVPKPSNALRLSLRAPKGHKVVVADLSGIELRVNMFLWRVAYAMELFRADPAKADLYTHFAANDLYHCDRAEITKQQRQVGKVSHLGLGFGAGAGTFQQVARLMGGVDMDPVEAYRVVNAYRDAHPEIVQGWRTCHDRLPYIMQGLECPIDPWELCWTEKDAIRLPSGRRIHYPGLHSKRENGKLEWWYGEGRHKSRIYAGKIDENIVQALARDVIAEHADLFYQATGLLPVLAVHDELVYIVPENDARDHLTVLQRIMRAGVSWWPELITWSEGDIADSYGEAK